MTESAQAESNTKEQQAHSVSLLMEHTARLVYEGRIQDSLHPVQWSALRYFNNCTQKGGNVTGLAKYLGVTTAPASRTTSSLLKRDLISVQNCPNDSRSKNYSVTQEGRDILRFDPIQRLSDSIIKLEEHELSLLAQTLYKVYKNMGADADDKIEATMLSAL